MKNFSRILLSLALVSTLVAPGWSAPSDYAPGEILVKFKPGLKWRAVRRGLAPKISAPTYLDKIGATEIKVPSYMTVQQAVNFYSLQPEVEFAEPDYIAQATFTPNDPLYAAQYGPRQINSEVAWNLDQGDIKLRIAILDTGIDIRHPEFAGKISDGQNMLSGYEPDDPTDDNGHGTHVAGIAAGIGNNGIGVAGMAWNCGIVPVKVLGKYGSGSFSAVAKGIIYAADKNVKIINMSLGAGFPSLVLANAVDYANKRGSVIIAAAGNNGSTRKFYPAAFPGVISVAATDSFRQRAGFSNYGSWVTVAAPGNLILSTLPDGYGSESGTSMACPMTAGSYALIYNHLGAIATTELATKLLLKTVDAVPGNFVQYGEINVGNAVLAAEGYRKPTYRAISVTPVYGTYVAGTTNDVARTDAAFYKVFAAPFDLRDLVAVEVSMRVFMAPTSILRITPYVVGAVDNGIAAGMIQVYNYSTATWEIWGSHSITTTVTKYSPGFAEVNLADYFDAGNIVKVRYYGQRTSRARRGVTVPFEYWIDEAGLIIVPKGGTGGGS